MTWTDFKWLQLISRRGMNLNSRVADRPPAVHNHKGIDYTNTLMKVKPSANFEGWLLKMSSERQFINILEWIVNFNWNKNRELKYVTWLFIYSMYIGKLFIYMQTPKQLWSSSPGFWLIHIADGSYYLQSDVLAQRAIHSRSRGKLFEDPCTTWTSI